MLALLSYAVFLIWSLLGEIMKSSRDLISSEGKISAMEVQVGEAEIFKNNYSKYAPNLEKMDQLFVDKANPVDFIKFLEDTAGSSQLDLKISLPPSLQSSSASVQNFIALQLSAKGKFSDALDFTKKIEMGPYLIEIENLTIQGSQEVANGQNEFKNAPKNSSEEDYASRNVTAIFAIEAFTKK